MNTRIPSHLITPAERRHPLRRHDAGGITIDRNAVTGLLPGLYATYGRGEAGVTLRPDNPTGENDELLAPHPAGGLRIRTEST